MTRDELRAEAKRLNIAGRSNMNKAQLEEAIAKAQREDATAAAAEEIAAKEDTEGNPPVHADDCALPCCEGPSTKAEQATVYGAYVDPGKIMGIHFRGRAMGAKHHALVNDSIAAYDMRYSHTVSSVVVHKPNSERVSAYETQNYVSKDGTFNYGPRTDAPSRDGYRAKLTHRQMRRIRKNAAKHGEDFSIQHVEFANALRLRHSLLARTPEGLGIFYRFSA